MGKVVDLDKLRSIGVRNDRKGQKRRLVHELGHVTTEHWSDRVDVEIRAKKLNIKTTVTEE